jgi:hypothetical protein
MARPIFLTGLARGGTNLLARMLIAGEASRIAIHAFQPWFKSLRNAIIARRTLPGTAGRFGPDDPFADGHFDEARRAMQELLHGAELDVSFAIAEWPELLERLQARAIHDAADLCPRLPALAGATDYRALMDRILALILQGHERGTEWVGLIDNWIIDLFPALARAYPEARFIVVIRDPRAVVASQLKFLDTDPTQVGHILSIIRQWRKYVVLANEFQHHPPLAGRLKFVRYEDQVGNPAQFAQELCDFLGLAYRPAMIDFSRYQDQGSQRKWTGNSNFEAGLQRIDPGAAHRWRRSLAPGALAAVEFCCGPDMEACGYAPLYTFDRLSGDASARAFLQEDAARTCAWRTDTGDADVEYGHETMRRNLLAGPGRPAEEEIRRAFLSPAHFELLRSRGRLFTHRVHASATA